MRRLLTSALLAVVAMLVAFPASSQAGVPRTFFGVNWDAEIAATGSDAAYDREWTRMPRAGVGTTRALFEWAKIEPRPGQYDFSTSDRMVRLAATHGVEVLPIVIYAPQWARLRPEHHSSPPRDPQEYAQFLEVLVARYGSTGTFWTENPQIARRPVRHWQIWNEPHLPWQWTTYRENDWVTEYGALLRLSYRAVKRRDPRARVVLAGLSNRSYAYLSHLYQRGRIKGSFDVAALHPYTRKPDGVIYLIKRFRRVMGRNGDARRPLWLTEMGLPASRGRVDSDSDLQTTSRGMARFLSRTYAEVARARRSSRTRVARVYWYTWASTYCCRQFGYAGLLRYDGADGVTATRSYWAYRASARRLR